MLLPLDILSSQKQIHQAKEVQRLRIRRKQCGARLKELRIQHGLTQEELAWQIHTTASNLAKIETGVSNPSIDLLYEIRSFFRIPIDYLLYGKPHLPDKLTSAIQETFISIIKLEQEISNLNMVESNFQYDSQQFSKL